jgi:ABC-2 type transport system ATP-binding protein
LSSEPLLDLRGVSFAYGSHTALRDVTLRLEPGSIGIVGNNGAGKSTLLKILLGLLAPTAGDGAVLGRPLGGGGCELRGRIGYLSETTAVVPLLGGAEFVALSGELYGLPRRDARRRAHETLDYVGLGEMRYRRLDEYSTGNLQRLKLAAALVHDPHLLLLDEPTNGLDPAGRAAMLRLIEDLIAETGKSVLLCTHLLEDVERVCRRVVVMHGGTVAEAGTIDELRRRSSARYVVRWQGEGAAFIEGLQAVGVRTDACDFAHSTMTLALPSDFSTSQLFALARQHGAAIVELRPVQEDLEQLFFRVTHAVEQPSPAGVAHAS